MAELPQRSPDHELQLQPFSETPSSSLSPSLLELEIEPVAGPDVTPIAETVSLPLPLPLPDAPTVYEEILPHRPIRDTVEGLVVALILAILIRGFQAEAFVIPTGSMANTLLGQHKEITCSQCGFIYTVNASDRNDAVLTASEDGARFDPKDRVASATCGNCRFTENVQPEPVFTGDRILVLKSGPQLPVLSSAGLSMGSPNRWDVTVFRYPESPETNYIKRLVGLPNEEIRIHLGDIYVRPASDPNAEFVVARKPWRQMTAMQTPVYDDRHRPKYLDKHPLWRRWREETDSDSEKETEKEKAPEPAPAWRESAPHQFQCRATGQGWHRLAYRHLIPNPQQWRELLEESVNDDNGTETGTRTVAVANIPPRATLITDFNAYNGGRAQGKSGDDEIWRNPHWCGDLALTGNIIVGGRQGAVRWELIRGGTAYRCELDLAKGEARMLVEDEPLGEPVPCVLEPGATYHATFCNIDGRLTLRMGDAFPFGEGLSYRTSPETRIRPTQRDLNPASILAREADVIVTDLVLTRDLYYTRRARMLDDGEILWDYSAQHPDQTHDWLSNPSFWESIPRDQDNTLYKIQPGHFFLLGDNSPRSSDSREWAASDSYGYYDRDHHRHVEGWSKLEARQAWEVPANYLIGRAFFLYWPHTLPFGPRLRMTLGQSEFVIPFRPYVERMGGIR